MVDGQSQTCFDFSIGKCDRGDGCKFEHSENHVPSKRQRRDDDNGNRGGRDGGRRRDGPGDSRGSNRGGGGSDRCFDFTVGRCDRGAACRFGHPETCYDFSIGKCDRGDDCRFFHAEVHTNKNERKDSVGAITTTPANRTRGSIHNDRGSDRFPGRDNRRNDGPPPVRNNQRGGANDGDVCFDFTVGNCDRGESCRFVHPETCFDASMGKCDRGDRCRFLHVGSDNRNSGNNRNERPAPAGRRGGGREQSRSCYDFSQGKCTRGDSCKFTHDEAGDQGEQLDDGLAPLDFPEDEAEPVGETCYDFSIGKCTRGDGCRFAHDPNRKHVPSGKRAAPY